MLSLRRKLVFFGLLFLIWEGLFRLDIWPDFLFPSPESIFRNLAGGFADGSYLLGILISLKRIAVGFGISLVLGVILGLLCSRIPALDETVGTIMLGFQSLPSICWFPLALLWVGLNERAILFVTIAGALFSIATATDGGVKGIPPIYLRAARTMGARGFKLYSKVILPAALPSILAGMRQGWSFAWRSLMAGELLSVNLGLGHLLMIGRELNDVSQVMAVVLLILAIGLLVDRLIFFKIETAIRKRWGLFTVG